MKKLMAIFIPLLVLAVVIFTAVIPTNVYAQTFDDLGLTISGSDIAEGTDYERGSTEGSNANDVLFILSDKEMTISGTATNQARIIVRSKRGANLTFSNLIIELNKGKDVNTENNVGGSFVDGNPSAAFAIDDSVTGEVTITLDGHNVLQSGPGHAGLENNSVPLVIKGEGKLEAYGYNGGAGIGGGNGKPGKNITIESGTVIATGSVITKKSNNGGVAIGGGAGIGGGNGCSGENITIKGGTVTAKSTLESIHEGNYGDGGGAGIGGGNGGAGSGITIKGGTVKATGIDGAGIGGGMDGDGKDITISGGEIYAKTTSANAIWHNGGAGIGGGYGGNGEGITISGGKIIAKNCVEYKEVYLDDDDDFGNIEINTVIFDDKGYYVREDKVTVTALGDGAGIGGGAAYGGKGGLCRDIKIYGSADVKVDGGINGAGIGGGSGGSGEFIKINLNFDEDGNAIKNSNGKIYARSQKGAAIGGGNGGDGKNIDISGSGTITAYCSGGAGIGGGNSGNGDTIDISGSVKIIAYTTGGAGIGGGPMVRQQSYVQGVGYVYDYIGGGGNNITITLTDGKDGGVIYATNGSGGGAGIGGGASGGSGNIITINSGTVYARSLDSNQSDKPAGRGAGIGGGVAYNLGGWPTVYFGGTGSNITINGGDVTAESGSGAGIGGGSGGNGSVIKIYGGDIKATSNTSGAGIGGGSGGNGSSIIIEGCESIKATGGGAGIGGGMNGNADTIKINISTKITEKGGGYIEAQGGSGGAGIGVGWYQYSGGVATDITISGGEIHANGGSGAAGIGAGRSAGCTDITISGGEIHANGGSTGAGIGAGSDGSCTDITISGGEIHANGGSGGVGIGTGSDGSCTDITISGGSVAAIGVYYTYSVTNSQTGVTTTYTYNPPGIGAQKLTIDGEDTVVNALGGGTGTGITGEAITINNGIVTAIGGENDGTGIGGENSTVKIEGTSSTSFPWVFTNQIISTNGKDGYWGIVFEDKDGSSFTDIEDNDFNTGTVYGIGKTVKLTETYTLSNGKILRVQGGKKSDSREAIQQGAALETNNKLTLAGILYIEAGAALNKYNKLDLMPTGEIQHEDVSPYVEDDYGKWLCDICGKEAPHNWQAEWVNDDTYHWHECDPGKDCSVYHRDITCPITENSKKNGYEEHEYDFDDPTYGDDRKLHYICVDCGYEFVVDIPVIRLIKEDENGDPLTGAEFGIYSDPKCEKPIEIKNPYARTTAVTEMKDGEAVVSFAAELSKTYYIKEIKAPDGYAVSGKVFKAVVDAHGKVTYGDVGSLVTAENIPVCENHKITPAPAKVIKIDGATKEPLAGAQFGLYSNEECTELIIAKTTAIDTDEDSATVGKAIVSFDTELNGTYYIKEIKAPYGYTASDKVFKAVVGADGKVTYGDVGSETAPENIPVCENDKIISDPAKVIKIDGATKEPLAGARFGLYSNEECTELIIAKTAETDNNNKAIVSFDTEINKTYYIKEIKAPDGYAASDKVFKAVVDANGKVTYGDVDSLVTSDNIPVCENEKTTPPETTPPETTPPETTPPETTPPETTPPETTPPETTPPETTPPETTPPETTPPETTPPETTPPETTPPETTPPETTPPETTPPETTVPETSAPSFIIPSSVKLIKVDSDTKNPLAGAEFGLYSDEGCTVLITTGTTAIDAYNKAVVSFNAERNKTYYIKETKAPDGYAASDEVFKAVVDEDGKVTYGTAGSLATSEDIPVCENKKIAADTSAPDMFVPDTSASDTSVSDTSVPDTSVPSYTPVSSAKLIKVDSATKNPLAGARFGLYSDEECTVLITTGITAIDSGNKAIVSFDTEPNRTYYIKEIKAPDGYMVSDEVFKAVVDADGKVTYGVLGSLVTSEDIPVCENKKLTDADMAVPKDNTSLNGENNPHTGIGLGAAGFVILSGIICGASLVKGAQGGRKRKDNDDNF